VAYPYVPWQTGKTSQQESPFAPQAMNTPFPKVFSPLQNTPGDVYRGGDPGGRGGSPGDEPPPAPNDYPGNPGTPGVPPANSGTPNKDCPPGYEWEADPTGANPNGRCKVIGTKFEDGCVFRNGQKFCPGDPGYNLPGNEGGTDPGGSGGGSPGWGPASPFPKLGGFTPPPIPGYTGPTFHAPAPFVPPTFNWNRTFTAPSYDAAINDPGYQFRLHEGLGALENNAAARGNLRTGGTLKGLSDYAAQSASQEYDKVFQRAEAEYNKAYEAFVTQFAANYKGSLDAWDSAFNVEKEKFDTEFAKTQAEYNPKLIEWQTNMQAMQRQHEIEFQAALQKWLHDNPSATDVLNAGR
jgi:hypothetical protein